LDTYYQKKEKPFKNFGQKYFKGKRMKKILIMLSLICTISYAHTLLMNVFENEDNTITVEGLYSSGKKTVGAMIKIESLISGQVLLKQRLPDSSEITIPIPKEPYQIVLDGGPGHIIVKEGIAPKEGYSKEIKEKVLDKGTNKLSIGQQSKNEWGYTTIFLFATCIFLLSLAIYFSNSNTQKIYKLIEEKK